MRRNTNALACSAAAATSAYEGPTTDAIEKSGAVMRLCLSRDRRSRDVTVTEMSRASPAGPFAGSVSVWKGTRAVHGVEVVGSLALLELARRAPDRACVFVPIVNPDGLHALRRTNARGVDLNRNFPTPAAARNTWHPMAGSSCAWSPYFRGTHPLSEPEAEAIASPREKEYLARAAAFVGAQVDPYRVMQARGWYPTTGDLDDWLDHELGTLALTIEVGRVSWGQLSGSSFWWMNPRPQAMSAAVDEAVRGCLALIAAERVA